MHDAAPTSPIVPFLHYAELDEAADRLVRVFGFRLRSIEHRPSGEPVMAVLQMGNGIVYARQEPDAVPLTGGRLYVYVDDVDAHHRHVVSSGILAAPPRDEPWGDRTYNTHDLQGHPWTFATARERT